MIDVGEGRRRGSGRGFGTIARGGILALVIALVPVHVGAELSAGASADERGFWKDVGLNAGAGVVNLGYIPVKILYAAAGGLVGGLAYLVTLGSTETANAIWEPTLGGTYVLTPKMLAGEEKLHFNGAPIPAPRESATSPDYPSSHGSP